MLTERLKDLEVHGIVERHVSASPARMEYGLTAKGHALHRVVYEIELWADQWESTTPGAVVTA